MDEYFGLDTLKIIARQPLEATNTADKYDANSHQFVVVDLQDRQELSDMVSQELSLTVDGRLPSYT